MATGLAQRAVRVMEDRPLFWFLLQTLLVTFFSRIPP